MDEITRITEEAFNRYFHTLSTLGYKSYNDVNKLLVLMFIEEIITNKLDITITLDELKEFYNAIDCLACSTCLIDYPKLLNYDSLMHK